MRWPELVEASVEVLSRNTSANQAAWGFGAENTWSFDQDAGELIWLFDDGNRVSAPAQIVGTFDESKETWLWSWANPSVAADLSKAAEIARLYGEEHELDILVAPKSDQLIEECWELAAITMHLAKFKGVYKGREGKTHVFFCFDEARLNTHLSRNLFSTYSRS